MRINLCLPVVVVSLLAITVSACGSSTTPVQPASFVIGADSVAGLQTSPATSYLRTSHYFGLDGLSSRPFSGACRLRFTRIGFSALFFAIADHATHRNCTQFAGAVVSGPRWHTANGLRIGSTVADLHRLYPRAYAIGRIWRRPWWGVAGGSTDWFLAPKWPADDHAAHTILTAYVKDGRVVALGEEVVGH